MLLGDAAAAVGKGLFASLAARGNRAAPVSGFAGQQVFDLVPLRFCELISPRHIHLTRLPTRR